MQWKTDVKPAEAIGAWAVVAVVAGLAFWLWSGGEPGFAKPAEQSAFESAVVATAKAYDDTTNPLKQKDAVSARAAAEEERGEDLEGWVGQIKSLREAGEGALSVTLKVGDDVAAIKAMEFGPLDTRLQSGGQGYRVLSEMEEGDYVRFWAIALGETSITEFGRMAYPEYQAAFYWMEPASVALEAVPHADISRMRAATRNALAGAERDRAEKEAACRQDVQCWGKKHVEDAAAECRAPIQRHAKYDYEWQTGTIGRFIRAYWHNKETGQLVYVGDQLKLQNGLGAWVRAHYSCTYDPGTNTVLQVEVGEGLL